MQLMNALYILNEIKFALSALIEKGEKKIINLSNFPLTYDDQKFLDETLGRGKVKIIYEGPEVTVWQESAIPGVWWGEYKNLNGKVILRTIEITDFPDLAKSQAEDMMEGIAVLERKIEEAKILTQ